MKSLPVTTARQLLEVTTLLMRSFAARMRQGEQRLDPAHIGILARLSAEPCRLTELAQHQAVRMPTMSRSVALLAARGWVERATPPENRRETIVSLTSEGRRVFERIKHEAENHVAGLLAPLTKGDRAVIEQGLGVLVEVLGSKQGGGVGDALSRRVPQ